MKEFLQTWKFYDGVDIEEIRSDCEVANTDQCAIDACKVENYRKVESLEYCENLATTFDSISTLKDDFQGFLGLHKFWARERLVQAKFMLVKLCTSSFVKNFV